MGGITKWFCETKDFAFFGHFCDMGACRGWECRVRDPFFLRVHILPGSLQVPGGGQGAPATLSSEVHKDPAIPMENDVQGGDSHWFSIPQLSCVRPPGHQTPGTSTTWWAASDPNFFPYAKLPRMKKKKCNAAPHCHRMAVQCLP